MGRCKVGSFCGGAVAEHHPRHLGWSCISSSDRASIDAPPQHGDAVGVRHGLSHLVRYQYDRVSLGDHGRDSFEEPVGFLGRQHCGGLVEDEYPGTSEELLQDLDPLLLTHGELPDRCGWIDMQPEFLGKISDHRFDLSHRSRPLPLVHAEHDVLRHRETIDKTKVLVDHADAMVRGVLGRAKLHCLAVD